MALYLLDTTPFSRLMDGDVRVLRRLQRLSENDRVVICPVVRGEIRFGIEKLAPGARRRKLETGATILFAVVPSEPVSARAADTYGRIKLEQQRTGLPLSDNDLWIAATAMSVGAVLVTSDSDFRRVPNLSVEDWTR